MLSVVASTFAGVKVQYQFRLRPGRQAERTLLRAFGMSRYVWNQMVAESKRTATQNRIIRAASPDGDEPPVLLEFGLKAQGKFLTALRATTQDEEGVRWLAEGAQVPQQQTVKKFAAARAQSFEQASRGGPSFKSKRDAQPALEYTTNGFSLKHDEVTGKDVLYLPNGVRIPVVWSRELPTAPKTVRVFRDAVGHWYATFIVDVQSEPLSRTGREIGVDWGVTTPAATVTRSVGEPDAVDVSDTYDLPSAGHRKKQQPALKRYHRMMARRAPKPGQQASKGYEYAKKQAAKAHRKAVRQRTETARTWANSVVRAHDRIAIEDFKPKFLSKSTMAAKAADNAVAALRRELEWQALKHGRDVTIVPARNTTQTCSKCGAKPKRPLPLSERTYRCQTCENTMCRDKNAALNIMRHQTG